MPEAGHFAAARDAPRGPPAWWPHRDRSSFATVGPLCWHVQTWPCGHRWPRPPLALLLHGTGSASFSWRHLAPRLSERFHVVAPDLPGHGFTRTPASQSLSLRAVADALAEWLRVGALAPSLVVGHSAGAAIALHMVLAGTITPELVVSINGAVLPLQGPVGRLFMPVARVLSSNPLVAPAFAAWASGPGSARRLLNSTGSRIDALGERCYAHLVADRTHAAGALRLMASWDLAPLAAELPRLATPLLLLAGLGDRTLRPSHAQRIAALAPTAELLPLPRLGHLAHEEDPDLVAALVLGAWDARRARTAAG